jgi:Bacterial regulatory proteins, luxR family
LSESTRAGGTPWALGVEERSRALVEDGDRAETLYCEAIDRLQPIRLRVDLARAHLLYGEWMRRERRRLDARTELRAAHDLFCDFGMRRSQGAHASSCDGRARTQAHRGHARPAHSTGGADRASWRAGTRTEIAAQLFISPITVEYHLRKAFRKLGLKSRTQLARRVS